MNKKKYRRIVSILTISMLLVTICYTGNVIINYYIPDELKLIEGQKEHFKFNIPIEVDGILKSQGVLKINESNIPKNKINIDLKKPFSVVSSNTGEFNVNLKLFGVIPLKKVKVNVIPKTKLIPVGLTIGVTVKTKGVLILGTGVVHGNDGINYEPSKGILRTGDYIIKVNNQPINSKEDFIEKIKQNKDQKFKLTIRRNKAIKEVIIKPVKTEGDTNYKIGVWIRDDMQGIGTMTYINKGKKIFGALGHGITDTDTKDLIELSGGDILKTHITTITKGQQGLPGEISGIIIEDFDSILGKVKKNTQYGIFGNINKNIYDLINQKELSIGLKYDVKEGEAIIKSCVDGKICDYKILIKKIYLGSGEYNKGMIIEVIDKDLLKKTNGIVQGMSGSPIIQNNKIIGAVTHVFVQNASMGYATFIENMLKSENE